MPRQFSGLVSIRLRGSATVSKLLFSTGQFGSTRRHRIGKALSSDSGLTCLLGNGCVGLDERLSKPLLIIDRRIAQRFGLFQRGAQRC